MSEYSEHKKIKSLWCPITDDDFDIDFSLPVLLFSDEGSITFVKSKDELEDVFDGCEIFEDDGKSIIDDLKNVFRRCYFGYMYVDEAFFNAVGPFKGKCIEDVKGATERTYMFVMFDDGDMDVLDIFDFRQDGTLYSHSLNPKPCSYFVNLHSVPAATPLALLM